MSSKVDKRDMLKEYPFSYRESKEKVLVYFNNKMIMTVAGKNAAKLMAKLSSADDFQEQLILAKITGNFKHGNEKMGKSSPK